MNWDAVGAIAESAGAIGVIATLVYLAYQIRANTGSVRASAYQEMERAVREVNLELARDPELSRIWTTGVLDFDALPPADRLRFANIAVSFISLFQAAEFHAQQETLPEPEALNWRDQLGSLCALPGFATWWERNEVYRYDPIFTQLIDRLIAEARTPAA